MARLVGDTDNFLERHFGDEPHVWHGDGFDDLLSLADVDAQIAGAGLRRPAVRLVRDGEVVEPTTWTRRARTGRTWVDDLVDPARVLDLFADGTTVVLQSLHRWWPALTRACRDLERAIGHPLQANAYLTPAGAAGLTPHHDTHDVFVLQVQGSKHWVVRAPVVDAPLARHASDHEAAARQPVLFEVDLEPGDALYLPRGYVHSAATQEDVSLHITIGVLTTTVHDLLRQLVERAADDPAFRRALPIGFGFDETVAARAAKDVAADFARWLGDLDTDDVGRRSVQRARRRRPPLLEGQLLQLAGASRIDARTRVVRRVDLDHRVVPHDGRVHVELPDRRIDLPAGVAPALDVLLDGDRHTVLELSPTVDERSGLVLVRRLVREAVLEVVDGP